MKILGIYTSMPTELSWNGKTVLSSINKKPIVGLEVTAGPEGIEGDRSADLNVHGGVDKAIYAYGMDVYPLWKQKRPDLQFGNSAMGENLTVEQLDETQFFVGDEYVLGSALLQVSEPRFPCFKLGMKYQDPKIIVDFNSLCRPGVYFRLLQPGSFKIGDVLKLEKKVSPELSITDMFKWKLNIKKYPKDWTNRAAQNPGLNQKWKERLMAAE